MTLHEMAAEIGRGLLTQLPSALIAALTMAGLTAASRKRRRRRSRTGEEGDSSSD